MKRLLLILLIILLALFASPVLADGATIYGNASGNYNVSAGADTLKINVNIPLTTEDVAYPIELFYFFAISGIVCILCGIWYATRPDYIPSIGILSCGILAFGIFAIAAIMAPYTATQTLSIDITNTAPSTIYLTEINNYVMSAWVARAMWGGAVAGFIMAVLGTLSFIGWFHRKGIKDANNGKYLETDVEGDEQGYKKYGRV